MGQVKYDSCATCGVNFKFVDGAAIELDKGGVMMTFCVCRICAIRHAANILYWLHTAYAENGEYLPHEEILARQAKPVQEIIDIYNPRTGKYYRRLVTKLYNGKQYVKGNKSYMFMARYNAIVRVQ